MYIVGGEYSCGSDPFKSTLLSLQLGALVLELRARLPQAGTRLPQLGHRLLQLLAAFVKLCRVLSGHGKVPVHALL